MTISPEALEKARAVAQSICDNTRTLIGENDIILIAAALQAERDAAAPKLPDDLAGLVRLLKALATDHECDDEMDAASTCDQAAAAIQSLVARNAELEAGLDCLVNAKALSGVRELVAGWNGERRPEGPYTERHPARLGATLPKTNCGAVYALDDAMQTVRSLLNKDRQP